MIGKKITSGLAVVVLMASASVAAAQCELTELTAADPATGDRFGYSVSMDGDHIVVGARGRSGIGASDVGTAYVFVHDAGTWVEQDQLTAADAAQQDYFGAAVSIDGSYVLVGAYGHEPGGSYIGSAYVFLHDDNGTPGDPSDDSWSELAKLLASDGEEEDFFGAAVCINGDYAVIGATGNDDACPTDPDCDSGSAYVFRRDDNGTPGIPGDDIWIEQSKLTASDAADGDRFGESVCIVEDYIVVGASGDDDGGNNSGSAYAFRRDDNGTPGDPSDDTWPEMSPKLTTTTAGSGDNFGISVSLDGAYVVVGARSGDAPGVAGAGSAHMFRLDDNGTPADPDDDAWLETGPPLTAHDAATNDYFGWSVSVHGDYVLVGARWDDDAGGASGSAYVFRRDDSATPGDAGDDLWIEEAKLVASDASGGDEFGISVSLDAGQAIVGAQLGDAPTVENTGSAYVFRVLGMPDCNANGVNDACELYEDDCDGSGVPDECETIYTDTGAFVAQLLASTQNPALVCMYDLNGDGMLNGADISGFVERLLS